MDVFAKTDTSRNTRTLDSILDSEWLKSTFIIRDTDIVTGDEYSRFIRKNRYFSSADLKFTSTSPGMNMSVNPKPQFTRYCDIRSSGKLNRGEINLGTGGHKHGLGMGRYYSEAIDDNQQRIFMRFGVPKFMPLALWMSQSFDIDRVVLANRGVITSTLLQAVDIISKVFVLKAAPLLSIGMFALNVIVTSSRFYSMRETMYTYWSTVQNILDSMVARRTMLPHIFQDFTFRTDNHMNREQAINEEFIESLNSFLPDVINPTTGRISVFTIALRAQKAFNNLNRDQHEANKGFNLSTDLEGFREVEGGQISTHLTNRSGETRAEAIVPSFITDLFSAAYKAFGQSNQPTQPGGVAATDRSVSVIQMDPTMVRPDGTAIPLDLDPNNPNDTVHARVQANIIANKSTLDKMGSYMLAEFTGGASFAVFGVEFTGSIGESFSNSSEANPIESTFNAISSRVRNVTNLLNSATSFPVVQDVMKLAADTGAVILSNATFGIANPLLALAYGANITMPKVWESSSATLPRANYKIKLISPYGNAYSQLFNIYLPLSMILAGSLPRGSGNTSYLSPFVCQLFDRGRVNINLGMIESVNVTRGTSNLAFSRAGHPNAIDVDISIANFDEIISADISSSGVLANAVRQLSSDFSDSPFTAYINSITAVDVYTQIYRIPMMRLKLAERAMILNSVVNPDPAAFAAFATNKVPFAPLIRDLFGNNQAAVQDSISR